MDADTCATCGGSGKKRAINGGTETCACRLGLYYELYSDLADCTSRIDSMLNDLDEDCPTKEGVDDLVYELEHAHTTAIGLQRELEGTESE